MNGSRIAARNALAERYLPVVRYLAERIRLKLPVSVELEDLIHEGTLGLLEAIEAFEPSRGVKFQIYCAPRVRGAILDSLRQLDHKPRLARTREKAMASAAEVLRAEHGFEPTVDELRTHLHVSGEQFEKIRRDSAMPDVISLHRARHETGTGKEVQEIHVLADPRASMRYLSAEQREIVDRILAGFDRAERLIIQLYHGQGCTMKEIGHAIGISESRVSQMHSSIEARLKARRAELAELEEATAA